MNARSRNKSNSLRAQRRIQINATHPLEKLLLQKPFFDPDERRVVVLHGNHHACLTYDPIP